MPEELVSLSESLVLVVSFAVERLKPSAESTSLSVSREVESLLGFAASLILLSNFFDELEELLLLEEVEEVPELKLLFPAEDELLPELVVEELLAELKLLFPAEELVPELSVEEVLSEFSVVVEESLVLVVPEELSVTIVAFISVLFPSL